MNNKNGSIMIIGLFLILWGTLLFLKKLGLLFFDVWPILWPSALIIIGIYLLIKKESQHE